LRDIKKKVKNLPVDLLNQKAGIHPSKLKNISFLFIRLEQSLFKLNLRLVLSIALQYKDKGLDLYDLVYEGVRGLKKAAEKFDIEKGYAFSTYAYPWIKEYIRAALASSLPITLPRHVYKLLTKVNAIKQRLASVNGRAPTDEELASEMGISMERFEIVRKAMALAARSNGATPLNYPNPRLNYHERTWEPILNDQGSVLENIISRENQPFEKMSNNVYSSDFMELIKTLPKEESSAIFSRLKGNSYNPSSGSTIQSNYIKGVKRLKRKALSDQIIKPNVN
jgi:RNA polymerase sigma factor (sigma-70 family)